MGTVLKMQHEEYKIRSWSNLPDNEKVRRLLIGLDNIEFLSASYAKRNEVSLLQEALDVVADMAKSLKNKGE